MYKYGVIESSTNSWMLIVLASDMSIGKVDYSYFQLKKNATKFEFIKICDEYGIKLNNSIT